MSYARGRAFMQLGQGLGNVAQDINARNEQEKLAAEREAQRAEERAWRESQVARDDERWRTQLAMTPGVEAVPDTVQTQVSLEPPPQPGRMLPELSNPFDAPPPQQQGALQRAASEMMPTLEPPDLPTSMTRTDEYVLPEGRTRIAPGLAYNTRHQQEEQERQRTQLYNEALEIFSGLGYTEAEAQARARGAASGIDATYRPLTREQQFGDMREATRFGTDESIRANRATREPPQPQLVQQDDGSMAWTLPPANMTPGAVTPAGFTPPPKADANRQYARGTPSWDAALADVKADTRFMELPVEQQYRIADDLVNGTFDPAKIPAAPELEPKQGGIGRFMRDAYNASRGRWTVGDTQQSPATAPAPAATAPQAQQRDTSFVAPDVPGAPRTPPIAPTVPGTARATGQGAGVSQDASGTAEETWRKLYSDLPVDEMVEAIKLHGWETADIQRMVQVAPPAVAKRLADEWMLPLPEQVGAGPRRTQPQQPGVSWQVPAPSRTHPSMVGGW
jgi:hypothetical protein